MRAFTFALFACAAAVQATAQFEPLPAGVPDLAARGPFGLTNDVAEAFTPSTTRRSSLEVHNKRGDYSSKSNTLKALSVHKALVGVQADVTAIHTSVSAIVEAKDTKTYDELAAAVHVQLGKLHLSVELAIKIAKKGSGMPTPSGTPGGCPGPCTLAQLLADVLKTVEDILSLVGDLAEDSTQIKDTLDGFVKELDDDLATLVTVVLSDVEGILECVLSILFDLLHGLATAGLDGLIAALTRQLASVGLGSIGDLLGDIL